MKTQNSQIENVALKLKFKNVELSKKIDVLTEAIATLKNYKKNTINKTLFNALTTEKASFNKEMVYSSCSYFYVYFYITDRYITIESNNAYIEAKESFSIDNDKATPSYLLTVFTDRLDYITKELEKNNIELKTFNQAIKDIEVIDALIEKYSSNYSYTLRQAIKDAYITRL